MGLVLITAAAREPIELEEAKSFLRVEVADDDTLIGDIVAAVREEVERRSGVALLTQTLDLTLDAFPAASQKNPGMAVEFPRYPLQSVSSITYVDSAGASQVLGASSYVVNTSAKPPVVVPAADKTWPATRTLHAAVNVTLRFVAGWTDVLNIPGDLRRAMQNAVAEMYERRETRVTGTVVNDLGTLAAAIGRHHLLPMGMA